MLSVEQCKKILNQNNKNYSNDEVEMIRGALYKLIEIIEKNKI